MEDAQQKVYGGERGAPFDLDACIAGAHDHALALVGKVKLGSWRGTVLEVPALWVDDVDSVGNTVSAGRYLQTLAVQLAFGEPVAKRANVVEIAADV